MKKSKMVKSLKNHRYLPNFKSLKLLLELKEFLRRLYSEHTSPTTNPQLYFVFVLLMDLFLVIFQFLILTPDYLSCDYQIISWKQNFTFYLTRFL